VARAAKIRIYSTPTCGYCAAAKNLLEAKQAEFESIDVSADRNELQKMIDLSGGRTVPQIFINDQSIGGYSELAALDSAGQLDDLLDQSPTGDQ